VTDAARDDGGPADGPRLSKEQKLAGLLEAASGLMAKQGFSQTTMRDVARETGFSLAGMYYYFNSKEDLLFQIQHGTFSRLLVEQETLAARTSDPEERLRNLLAAHLAFFHKHSGEMKVCTFELESLNGESYEAIEDLRRRYYRLAAGLVAELLGMDDTNPKSQARIRHLTLFIFGALNWVFMWYQPKKDVPMARLAEEMTDFVMGGLQAQMREGA
jgi:AcrR family transcriptional regulator